MKNTIVYELATAALMLVFIGALGVILALV